MKNFLTLAVILIASLSYSQKKDIFLPQSNLKIKVERANLQMSGYLEPYLNEFVDEAGKRGDLTMRSRLMHDIDLIYILSEFDSVYGDTVLGVTVAKWRTIYINPRCFSDTIVLKRTLYHEIGHALTRSSEHTCDQCSHIMGTYEVNKLELDRLRSPEIWATQLDEYFNWLNGQ